MADIAPSSRCPRAEILKTSSHEPIMQSIVDWFGRTDDWLWKSSRFPTLNNDGVTGHIADGATRATKWREPDAGERAPRQRGSPPLRGTWVSRQRVWTMKTWGPWQRPSVYSWATTSAWFVVRPTANSTHRSELWPIALTFDPWPPTQRTDLWPTTLTSDPPLWPLTRHSWPLTHQSDLWPTTMTSDQPLWPTTLTPNTPPRPLTHHSDLWPPSHTYHPPPWPLTPPTLTSDPSLWPLTHFTDIWPTTLTSDSPLLPLVYCSDIWPTAIASDPDSGPSATQSSNKVSR